MRAVYGHLLLIGSVFAAGCGANFVSAPGANVIPIHVDGGPTANQVGGLAQNLPFVSVKICAPGSSNCVTVDGILLDTNASGLRIFDTQVASLNLPAVNTTTGSPAYDCFFYPDGSYEWGSVQQADIILAGETAAKVPIHVLSSSPTNVPLSCSNGGPPNINTATIIGGKGILGVGFEPTDCWFNGLNYCDPSYGPAPFVPAYFSCSGGTCNPAFVDKANQVTNPVTLFPTDNNGVIVKLPSASNAEKDMTGSLVFGIGTEPNNQLHSGAAVITLACDGFNATLSGQKFGVGDPSTCAGFSSIDVSINANYFPNVANLPVCPSATPAGNLSGFYCPSTTQNFSLMVQGLDGTTKAASFNVANAQNLYTSHANDAVLPDLAGPLPDGYGIALGLPFFYGKDVYISTYGQKVPTGTPPAPWWAF